MSYELVVPLIGATWVAIGVVLSIVMRRKGHLGLAWFGLGTLMGPVAVLFALDTIHHDPPPTPQVIAPGTAHRGTTDVLLGVDGSPGASAAVEAALRLFRRNLGRLTLAAVIDFDESPGSPVEAMARANLELQAVRVRAHEPAIELFRNARFEPELIVLRGSPARVLAATAAAGGYGVLVVGSRGAGLAKTVLGSVAQELATGCPVPVLLVTPAATAADHGRAGDALRRVSS